MIGITWPIPAELDDTALERKLFAPAGYNPSHSKPLPDWSRIHAELRRRGVTLALLWEEYRASEADGYGYSRLNYCRPGEPSVPSSGEHRVMDEHEDEKHEPGSAS